MVPGEQAQQSEDGGQPQQREGVGHRLIGSNFIS